MTRLLDEPTESR